MKRLILVSAITIALGAVLLELIRNDSGYVLIAVGSTTIEMSFWTAVGLLLLVFLGWWLASALLRQTYRLTTGGLGLTAKRQRRVERRTNSGLIHFVESNWRAAKRDLLKAAQHAPNPLVHYLAAARCSFELGEPEETRRLLQEAEKIAPRNELAVVLSQARMQLLDKKYEQCLATLERARTLSPHHPTVLDLLRQVYWQLREWTALRDMLPELRKQKLYKEDEQAVLEQSVYMALLSDAGKQAEKHPEAADKLLANAWHGLPKKVRVERPVVALYGKLLIAAGRHEAAEKLLRERLNRDWHSELITLYGLVAAPQLKEQLIVAEQWLRERPADAELMLALGRISLRNQLWGKAREYFEISLKLKACPETHAELARLLAYLGEHEKSTELYQQGLLTSTNGLPPLPMPGQKPEPAGERRLPQNAAQRAAWGQT